MKTSAPLVALFLFRHVSSAKRAGSSMPLFIFVALFGLGGLFSCQRAPQAYFAPTHYPAAQRTTPEAATPLATSAEEPALMASIDESATYEIKPVWESAPQTTAPARVITSSGPTRLGNRLFRRNAPAAPCDQIVLRNGDVVEAKVKEVGVNEIRYKKCDRPDGPDYTISKRDVLSIKYGNGEVERFNAISSNSSSSSSNNRQSYQSPTSQGNDGPRTDPFAIVAISAGGLAIFTGLGSLLLGAAAVVFGAMSLSRIRREPGRFKGKGLATAGMILGIVAAAVILLYVYL